MVYMIILECHNIGMMQTCQVYSLIMQQMTGKVVYHIGIDDLDCHFLVAYKCMFCQIHRAHATFSYQGNNLII